MEREKTHGIDGIHNEVLKNEPIIKLLQVLFQFCFDTGKVPSLWRKALIRPIPKGSAIDTRIPLNFRGISLLSVIAKCYSSTLNNRVQNFLEDNGLIVNEQFRRDWSCEDHVFSLNCLIQDRKSTFATFVDLQKAFDYVDRDLLQYKLH